MATNYTFLSSNYYFFLVIALYKLPVMATPDRYVLTGGQSIGKTTMIEYLKDQGFQVCPEAFTQLFEEAKAQGPEKQFFFELEQKPDIFQKKIIQKQLEMEDRLDLTKPAFLDRAVPDGIAFARHYKFVFPEELVPVIRNSSYELAFFLDPLPESCFEKADFRREDPVAAASIHCIMKEVYMQLGHSIIIVPFDTVENRAAFILNAIAQYNVEKKV